MTIILEEIEQNHSRRPSRVIIKYNIEKLREMRTFKREPTVKRLKRKFSKFMDRLEMMQILY